MFKFTFHDNKLRDKGPGFIMVEFIHIFVHDILLPISVNDSYIYHRAGTVKSKTQKQVLLMKSGKVFINLPV